MMSISDEEIRHARNVVAEIVATHDPKYAPLFEILDVELKKREFRANLISKTFSKSDLTNLRGSRRKRRKSRLGKGG
jgi:hypothetical protein